MLTTWRIRNFKSWRDSGDVALGRITAVFGANSSGKSALFEVLRLLEGVALGQDRVPLRLDHDRPLRSVLHVPGEDPSDAELSYCVGWQRPLASRVKRTRNGHVPQMENVRLEVAMRARQGAEPMGFSYTIEGFRGVSNRVVTVGLQRTRVDDGRDGPFELIADGIDLPRRNVAGIGGLAAPPKGYAFPPEAQRLHDHLEDFTLYPLAFEKLFDRIHHVGPLRVAPELVYGWSGDRPRGVGYDGRATIAALASMRSDAPGEVGSEDDLSKRPEASIAAALSQLHLVDDFRVESLGPGQRQYRAQVRMGPSRPWIDLLDVGTGVGQVLPIITQCWFAEEGSTLFFDLPEAHLHPSAQAALADVLLHAANLRNLQIVVECHSEHFLHRLQRRIAEHGATGARDEATIDADAVKLYFTRLDEEGSSMLDPLRLDAFGNITNWPDDFFGDPMSDLVAMVSAESERLNGGA